MREPWLLLETSGRGGWVGLAEDGAVVASVALDPARRHNRDLAPAVADVLAAHGLTPAGVRGVVVGVGPGSYTGLRVGLMSAKAFAWAAGCRLVAVPTFAAVAEGTPDGIAEVDVIADALQGLLYVQRFRRNAAGWDAADELRIEPAKGWAARAAAWVTGPGVSVADAQIPAEIQRVPVEHRLPTLAGLFRAGRRLPPVSDAELMRLEPLYLRGSSAEEKAKLAATSPPAGPAESSAAGRSGSAGP